MELLGHVSRWSHVVFGLVGLIAFWFPVFARKGGRLHRRAGAVFVWCGYGVTATALLSCTLYARRLVVEGAVAAERDTLALLVFLAYLAVVTFVMLRYAVGVLRTKDDPTRLATPQFRALAVGALLASAGVVVFGVVFPSQWSILLVALSPVGFGIGVPMLRYMRGALEGPRAWWLEHMRATLSAGIAFHTAFAVFGLRRVVDLSAGGWLAMLPWILPTLVGTPALVLWRRYYRRKFQGSSGHSLQGTAGPSATELAPSTR